MAPSSGDPSIFRTVIGRLFLLSAAIAAGLVALQQVVDLPPFVDLFRRVASLAALLAGGWLGARSIARTRRRFLWRVRRKLILSYVFLGFVPVFLVVVFALAGGVALYINVAAYVFHETFREFKDDVRLVAETSAGELSRAADEPALNLARRVEDLAREYPALSMTAIPIGGSGNGAGAPAAGPWRHLPAPTGAPAWLSPGASFEGLVAYGPGTADDEEWHVAIRAAVPTADGRWLVVADLPVDTEIVARIDDRASTRIGAVSVPEACGGGPAPERPAAADMASLFRRSVAFMDCRDWVSGRADRVAIAITAPLGRLYGQIVSAQSGNLAQARVSFLRLLVVFGAFLLIVQVSALVVGGFFARSITYAVHELFQGTERVRRGDFSHRIRIESDDQLGELAASFNRMSASIEHLLHVQREKQRLDDELRIARDIQKSLLPPAPPDVAGLEIADLCEPAREVGGDYYDFFDLGPRRLGVMIADVSGKGTSAALYMAELKGLMMALSSAERSPRALLIDVNRRLAAHLDNRSFITMTYAVIDLERGTLTCARAGHTPLIASARGVSEIVAPNGMVLGLRLPGAGQRFEELLEEHTRPFGEGDVAVLYTDGVTEAMDPAGELFGDEALAALVARHQDEPAAAIRERVVRDVRAFVGTAESHDDMTMVVIKRVAHERT
jgi:sigma-B regulation protein RsbU (phosphoserine phosphatase)